MSTSQEETQNTFHAQPDCNPNGQHPGSTLGGPQQDHAKAITVLMSCQTIGIEAPPPIPLEVEDDGDEVERLIEKDQSEDWIDDKREGEGKKDELAKDDSTEGEFKWWLSKDPVIEGATTQPLPAPFPQRLQKINKRHKANNFLNSLSK